MKLILINLSLAGYDIPEDTMVLINNWGLHRDPDYWPNPEEFRPERFLDSQGKLAPKPTSFLPFSAGRRSCVGEVLAKATLMAVIPMWLQRVNFRSPPGKTLTLELEDSSFLRLPKPYDIVAEFRE